MEDKELLKLYEIIDENSKSLVGILLKRIEILEGQNLSFEQIKSLFSELLKNHIYENSRYLKKLISATLTTGTIIFRTPTEK